MICRNHRTIRAIQYRLFTLIKVLREVSVDYSGLICGKLLGRPFSLIGIGGFTGILIGMNVPFIPGIIMASLAAIFGVIMLQFVSSNRRSRELVLTTDFQETVVSDSNKRRYYDTQMIVIFAIIFVYSFSFTSFNKYRSECFMDREIEEGSYNKTYEGYIIDAPLSVGEESASSYVFQTSEGVKISFFSTLPGLRYGDYIEITGKISKHRGPNNPGGFDYASYYSSDGIYLKLSVSDAKIRIQPERYRQPGWMRSAYQSFYGLRERMIEAWRKVVSEEDAGVLGAMILGDKSGLSEETKSRFRSSNLSHLIAVSGLHVSCFLVPVLFCFKITGKRRVRQIGIIVSLLFFGFLTGWTASVARAVIMSVYGVITSLFNKRTDSLSGLFASSVILQIINPYIISDIGFQLSFSATLSIILLARRLSVKINRWLPQWLSRSVASMISAQLGMIPVLIKLSAKQSPALMVISIAGTMLSQGICTFAIPISAIYFVLSQFILDNDLFTTLFLPVRGLIYLLDRISRVGALDFIDAMRMESLAPLLLLGIFGLALVTVMKRSTAKGILSLFTAIILVSGITAQIYLHSNRPIATIVFFDVGQGDSTLILSHGKSVLIDGGEGEQCCRVLLPALNYYGIRKVDVVLMSHLHSDHGGGLLELLSENRADHIGVPFFGEGDDYDALVEGYRVGDIFYLLKSGDSVYISDNTHLDILHPTEPSCNGGNEDSLVIKLTVSGTGVLFMGDSGFATEEQLMNNVEIRSFLDHNIDIMKVGHHGSKYATSEEFLSLLAPEAAVICVGPNFYGHPTNEAISRLKNAEADVYRTDCNGAIILEIYEEEAIIRTMFA